MIHEAWEVGATLSGLGNLGAVALILTGRLIPRATVDKLIATLQEALSAERTANAVLRDAVADGLPAQRTTATALSALPRLVPPERSDA